MRTVTVTEKFRAVQEGKMAKSVFLQQMKREYPFFISQFDSFDSSVAILKNKGMLYEEKKDEVYDKDYYRFSDEGVRRGTDVELEKMGIDSSRPGNIDKEDLAKAKETALKNLRKDPLYYLNLLSGDSLHVDKNDQPYEYKKGKEKDVFNGMKKAELKEEVSEADAIPTEPGIPGERASNHNRKMALRKIIDFLTKDGKPGNGFKVSNQEALDFIKTHRHDIFSGDIDANDINDVWDNYDEYEAVNRPDVDETAPGYMHDCAAKVMHEKYGNGDCIPEQHTLVKEGTKYVVTHYDVLFESGKTVKNIPVEELKIITESHHGHKRNKKKNEEVEEQMTDQQMKDIQNYGKADKIVKPFKPGDAWSDDFDYEGMLEAGLKVRLNTPLETMEALYGSFEDVNYHSENQHLGAAIDAKKEGDKSEALDHLRNFRKAVKETLLSLNEGGDPMRDVEEVMGYNRRGEKEQEPRPSNYTKVSEKRIKENFPPSPNTHLPEFANAEDFDVATAFEKARVDMSKPVAVMYHYGHAQYSGEDTDFMSAQAAVKKLEAERQENRKNYTDDGEEVPSDRHGYEFENYSVLEEDMPEGHEYKLSYYLDGDYTYAITQEKSGVSEKKGKDHDGDGDIDSDDYMAAKDKAIKKAMGKEVNEDADDEHMVHELIGDLFAPGNARSHLDFSVKVIAKALEDYKEGLTRQGVKDAMDLYDKLAADGTLDKQVEDGDGFISSKHVPKLKKAFQLIGLYGKGINEDIIKKNIKHIITKVLEEQTINEAATNQLSKLADDYQDFKGMQVVINDLENIVTDVESFYAKTKDRLQGVMDKVGDVSNAEGLKVGAFIAPAIEAAFRKDLRPVTSKGFTKDLNIPKVRRISQADIDRGYVDESEPKQTVYSPVNEKKK